MDNNQSNKTFPQMEQEILGFWDKAEIFQKSLEKNAPNGDYSFYDGPPFATGLPHYGHIVASTMKDVIPRYKTMRGYRVERKWGWDCHGLPIENIAEKELGSKKKKDIEAMGVEKFNEICRSKVLEYVEAWKIVIRKLGRWADMENDYKTMDLSYMESVWWVFKELWDKGLIYESYRSMHICPRCETTLSQMEVSEGYKNIKDLSATVKFELVDEPGTFILAWTTTPWTLPGNVALAVGEDIEYVKIRESSTTTINSGDSGKQGTYAPLSSDIFILARKIFAQGDQKVAPNNALSKAYNFHGKTYEILEEFEGSELIGKKYKPLMPYLQDIVNKDLTPRVIKKIDSGERTVPLFAMKKDRYTDEEWKNLMSEMDSSLDIIQSFKDKAYRIYGSKFVNTDEGTGIVHIAPGFGDDDYQLVKKENFGFLIQHIGADGRFIEDVVCNINIGSDEINAYEELNKDLRDDKLSTSSQWVGVEVKPKDDPAETDVKIVKWLGRTNKLFHKEKYPHSYPHCWRCDTPLINYATSSWFVNVLKIKDDALRLAKEINWFPEHIKEGRFGKWLEGARDWSISRQRFWASVIPIWKCECGEMKVFGSVADLEKASGQKITDIHKHIVDKIKFPCEKCGKEMTRIPDVLDTWFDSGSMPYAQMHYPFENKEKFEKNFPAEFIAEGPDQTRAWFYYLHVIGTVICGRNAFNNVIVNGIVLAEDGKKMSKKLQNYPDPSLVMDKYGADAMRIYLMSSPVVGAEDLNFSEKGVEEALRKNVMTLWNVYKFYELFKRNDVDLISDEKLFKASEGMLDKWILVRLNELIAKVTENMDGYDLAGAARPITEFIDDLSTWYLRRSRDRFKSENQQEKENALMVLGYVLIQISKVIAPFMPFIAEEIWQKTSGNKFQSNNKSVHLENWPAFAKATAGKPEVIEDDKNSILEKMNLVRKIVEISLADRKDKGIKIRQVLQSLTIKCPSAMIAELSGDNEAANLIKDELNIKEIKFVEQAGLPAQAGNLEVEFDTNITPELQLEGLSREVIRTANTMRKELGLSVNDLAKLYYSEGGLNEVFDKFGKDILRETLCTEYEIGDMDQVDAKKEILIGDNKIVIGIKIKPRV